MDFIAVRDLRVRPGEVWRRLRQERELILTSSGRPFALLVSAEEDVEETLAAVRQARAQIAVSKMRQSATARGPDTPTDDEIRAEIQASRRER